MKIVKREKLAILSIALMVIVGGYVNYKYNPEREKTLGQTVLVNSKDIKIYEEEPALDKAIYSPNKNKLDKFREEKEIMYNELYTNYTNIINLENSDKEQIKIYQDKLNKIIKEKNVINLLENIIKTYGIEDNVIVKTGENVNVILLKGDKEISKEIIAKITLLVKDELDVPMSKISVSYES